MVMVDQKEPTDEKRAEAKTPEARAEPKLEAKTEPKLEAKTEPKTEPKLEARAELKLEPRADPKPPMPSAATGSGPVLLVAWGDVPTSQWAPDLERAGYHVHVERHARITAFQWANEHQPIAAVIDLSTKPEDGRALASTLRVTPTTRDIPLVFIDGSGSLSTLLDRLATLRRY
jgi:CheY-like chemotaxis protein